MPHSNKKLLSLDPLRNGLIPKFLWPNGSEVDSTDHGVAGNLSLTARSSDLRAQCNFVRSLISKAKSKFLTNLVTESSSNPRTFGLLQIQFPPQPFQFIPWLGLQNFHEFVLSETFQKTSRKLSGNIGILTILFIYTFSSFKLLTSIENWLILWINQPINVI